MGSGLMIGTPLLWCQVNYQWTVGFYEKWGWAGWEGDSKVLDLIFLELFWDLEDWEEDWWTLLRFLNSNGQLYSTLK